MRVKNNAAPLWHRLIRWCLASCLFFTACTSLEIPAQPTPVPEPATRPAQPSATRRAESPTRIPASTPVTVNSAPTPMTKPESQRTTITIRLKQPTSHVTIKVIESTPVATVAGTHTIPPYAEPVVFTGMSVDQKCGHGDVVAIDGHPLRATPRIPANDGNFLELLPEGARVDIIDCRLWTDQEGLSWLAVRTFEKKLGWMLVQPDKFYVTLYPVHMNPPQALTGVPAGATIAYVPPSECKSGPVSTKAMATSIGIDLIPVVGDVKGLIETATGCDLVTGESLGNWRWLGLLGIIGLSEIALMRHSDEVADTVRVVDNLDGCLRYSDEVVMAAARNADNASDFLKHLGKAGDVADDAADAALSLDRGLDLSDEAIIALAKLEEPCSFGTDTLVSTPTGLVPISEVRPATLVLAYNESLDVTDFYTVTASTAHLDPTTLVIAIGSDVLETTPEHPFFVEGEWVPAGDLAVGDLISSASGEHEPVLDVTVIREPQVMYNLTVAQAHTYYVGTGEWLVHNACSRILRRHLDDLEDWQDTTSWQAHHIIPQQHENHAFVTRASGPQGRGWDIDGADNGIALPVSDEQARYLCKTKHVCLPTHRGSHSHYSAQVQQELDLLEDRAVREAWTQKRAAQELTRLTRKLRTQIQGLPAGPRLH